MIFLSIGSNLSSSFGDRFKNIDLAIDHIESFGIKIINKSSFYETPSYPNNNNPKFINVVVSIETNLSPPDLMSLLLSIEEQLERKRNKKNDPRTCDIDIIDFNNQVLNFKYKNLNLAVPHKELTFRNFVLFPLQEITSQWKHPKTNENVGSLINELSKQDKKSILKIKKN